MITESFKPQQNYSCIYKLEDCVLTHIDYKSIHYILPTNNTEILPTNFCYILKDRILEILIETCLKQKLIPYAFELICINKYQLRRFYERFYPKLTCPEQFWVETFAARIFKSLNLLLGTDDSLCDVKNDHLGQLGFPCFAVYDFELDNIRPWSFSGEYNLIKTPQPTVFFTEDFKNLSMNQVYTGPHHYETVWLGGRPELGIIDVVYYKNPIIFYKFVDWTTDDDIRVSPDFFLQPEWEGFGRLARTVFGVNAGIFFGVNEDLPDEFVFHYPVVFEV